jgi:hypothetical protein
MSRQAPADRFWAKVEKHDDDCECCGGCWHWQGALERGYGSLSVAGKNIRAHRFSYELHVRPIPTGLVIDHLCRVRHCVNPAHLEVVESRENILRGVGATARNHRKTHCSQGHPYDEANTRIRNGGGRDCRACHRARIFRRYWERKAA